MTRKGYSDPRIAASPQSATYNMGLFVEFNEVPPHLTSIGWKAALSIAMDLESICLRHAAERQAGLRTH
jgi:hypothetical protein